MFGYIYVNEQELKIREYTAYRSFYCGLCRNLHQRYGRIAQIMLNYDLTFLALLLTGLYEPDTEKERHRCLLHPLEKHEMLSNDAVSYAADMCVLLSWYKLKDDWKDEHSLLGAAGAALLKKSCRELIRKYPRQAKAIAGNISLLDKAEKEGCRDLDYVSGLTGHFLAEIFVWKEDMWQEDLRQMGFYLGKFIYLMDALEDLKKDRKHGNYNIFQNKKNIWEEPELSRIRQMLADMMMPAARAFERLPVLENAEIIRNILYSGVWCKYVGIRETNQKKQKEQG